MSDIPPHAARLPNNAALLVLDPTFGPTRRAISQLSLAEEVLVQSGGILCFRPIVELTRIAVPDALSLISQGSVACNIPSADLVLEAKHAIALPQAGAPLAAPVHQPLGKLRPMNMEWMLVRVATAECLIVNNLSVAAGPLSRNACRSMSESIKAFVGPAEIRPIYIDPFDSGAIFHFDLPPKTQAIRLVTPTNSAGHDIRRLGVAVTGVALDENEVALDSPIFARGFYQVEACDPSSWRWTDGDAWLLLPKQSLQRLAIAITNWHLTPSH